MVESTQSNEAERLAAIGINEGKIKGILKKKAACKKASAVQFEQAPPQPPVNRNKAPIYTDCDFDRDLQEIITSGSLPIKNTAKVSSKAHPVQGSDEHPLEDASKHPLEVANKVVSTEQEISDFQAWVKSDCDPPMKKWIAATRKAEERPTRSSVQAAAADFGVGCVERSKGKSFS